MNSFEMKQNLILIQMKVLREAFSLNAIFEFNICIIIYTWVVLDDHITINILYFLSEFDKILILNKYNLRNSKQLIYCFKRFSYGFAVSKTEISFIKFSLIERIEVHYQPINSIRNTSITYSDFPERNTR